MALCLLASLAVVPAAAASLSELESALNAAKAGLSTAQKELTEMRSRAAAAADAVKEAERNLEKAQSALATAEKALEDAKNTEGSGDTGDTGNPEGSGGSEDSGNSDNIENTRNFSRSVSGLEEAVKKAKEAVELAEKNLEKAKEALKSAPTDAEIKEKEDAVKAAQEKVDQAQKAYDEAKKGEETTDKPTHPDSDDITVSGYVDLGTLEKNASTSSRTGSFTVRNTSGFDMSFSVGTASGYKISAPSSISAGSSATVTVELNSSNGVGTYNRSLDMSVSFKDGDGQSYSFSTKLYAEVVEKGYALAADPASKDLGKLKEGYSEKEAKEKEVTVSIQNKGASSVRMDGVKGNDHFTVTAVGDDYETLKNGEKASYKIVPKQGLAVGTYTDTITFLTRENTNATFKATVVIEKKLDPLTVEPNPLDFGVAEEGYAALTQKTVTVKNNTDYAIRLNQPTSYSYEISLLSQTSLPAGSSATFTIRPRTGLPANLYDGVVEVYGSSNDNTLAAKLNVKFSVNRPAGPSTFSDVAAGSTFAADIAYVSQKGLMSGKGGGLFKPQESITRGQLVTILYRLEGQPAVSGAGFPDVAAGSYCEKAVKWAAANGITAGGKDGLFRPNDSITREQLATFLYRYNNYKGYVVAKQADLSAFSDSGSVSSYAKDALSWANGTGLVNGTSDGRLNPSGGATRGQAAAILHRFCVSIGR